MEGGFGWMALIPDVELIEELDVQMFGTVSCAQFSTLSSSGMRCSISDARNSLCKPLLLADVARSRGIDQRRHPVSISKFPCSDQSKP